MSIDIKTLRQIAWTQVSLLRAAEVLPPAYEGRRIGERATPIHDLNGEELYHRLPLMAENERDGARAFVDLAVHPAMGELLVGVSHGVPWHEERLLEEAKHAARKREVARFDDVRFVVYSYPKVAAQFLNDGREVGLLELFTWEPVPKDDREDPRYEPPSNFQRWSWLDSLDDERRRSNERRFEESFGRWREEASGRVAEQEYDVVSAQRLARTFDILEPISLFQTRELAYSRRSGDHHVCYELRGQETNVWCVAASVQMILDFYRYEYDQTRLAAELGLGTPSNPNGLPYSQDFQVVTVLEKMTSNALDAAMTSSPYWSEFRSEISANRPLVSFIPGHSRTVAGTTESFISLIGQPPFRGLLVYDPWPPNAGVITRWENYNVGTYRRTFTARVQVI